MLDSDTVTIELIVQDSSVSSEKLQQIIQIIAAELKARSDSVSLVEIRYIESNKPGVPKGDQFGGILDVKINLETLRTFSKWLAKRLIGSSTEVIYRLKEGEKEVEVKINGDEQAQEIGMQNFERFVAAARDSEERK
jgi:hypothetical protein